MRTPGGQPRILLTNVNQLELLLTRHRDVELFDDARLDYLVFDEAHTFTGAHGAEAACLIRRLRSFCGSGVGETVCVATSATIVDGEDPGTAREFASRFFGVEKEAVAAVREVYEEEVWASDRRVPKPPDDPRSRLDEALAAVDAEDPDAALRKLWPGFTGEDLPAGPWEEALHRLLSKNELLYQAADLLLYARPLADLLEDLRERVGREVTEEELILWLTLGAAARVDDRPLVRPVVHAFIRGVPGAVVTFEDGETKPKLHLSAEEDEAEEQRLRFRVSTCTTCGQHYFEHALADFEYTSRAPGGGKAEGTEVYWEAMDPAQGGVRVLLVDRLISSEEEGTDEDHPKLATIFLCRECGGAHGDAGEICLACGRTGSRLPLLAVQQKAERPGHLTTCVSCGSHGRNLGGRYREPARPVRATNVADVHVLAQDMLQHAERRRLLIFADNRQDAAFQAGWMRDHARRYRLRALMMNAIREGQLHVGDLVHRLDRLFDEDDSLSSALLPEVWVPYPKEAGRQRHTEERRYFLRIVLLRELTMGTRQQIGLEPWGRLRVAYQGLEDSHPFVQRWAGRLRIPADELTGGIAAFLDTMRRKRILLDRFGRVFSRIWNEGDRELEGGYLPDMRGVPKGVKLMREGGDDENRIDQWFSPGHPSTGSQIAIKWGVEPENVETFLKELWECLTAEEV